MKTKLVMLGAIMGAAACLSASGMAADTDRGELNAADDQAEILKDFDRIYFEAPLAADLAVMNVRVYSPDNELLLSTRSVGEPVEFLLDSDLPDGTYRYEAVSIFGNMDLSDRSTAAKSVNEESFLLRKFGSFKVSDGQVSEASGPDPRQLQLQQQQATGRDDAALLDRVIRQAINLAGMTLDFLIPSAQAQDLMASSGSPSVFFDDTQDEDCTPAFDWSIETNGGTIDLDTNNTFIIAGWSETLPNPCVGGSVPIITLNNDGGEGANDSGDTLVVDSDGDIHWAQGGMNYDKGLQNLSIGTATTGAELVLSAIDPEIRYRDESFTDYMYTNYDTNWFNIGYQGGAPNTKIAWNAPADSFIVDGAGNANFGGAISVGSTAPQVGQFAITENGIVRFEMIRTDLNKRWRFTNVGDKFAINQVDVAGTEFQVFENGDVLITGALTQNSDVNAKQDIVPVDRHNVLAKIINLPIAEWSYKDAANQRHIGPMAQDFYAAFGLGRNEKGISTLDSSGVALAGIQALAEENDRLSKENRVLQQRLDKLESQQSQLQAVVLHMQEEQQVQQLRTSTALN